MGEMIGIAGLINEFLLQSVDNKIRLETVTRVISAGAAVPIRTIRRMQNSLYQDADIHTPYGATECLPVSSISAAQMDDKLVDRIESGDGVCVGRPIDPNKVRIIKISEMAFNDLSETTEMPFGMPGEIVVSGPSCTDSYWERDTDTDLAKVTDSEGNTWHRMGDVGIMDGLGRLWYCGRVSQRVETGQETLFADQCGRFSTSTPTWPALPWSASAPRAARFPCCASR
jgi:acyl-CoA synthetase (AMP-forming)/AMP-acid ligase II